MEGSLKQPSLPIVAPVAVRNRLQAADASKHSQDSVADSLAFEALVPAAVHRSTSNTRATGERLRVRAGSLYTRFAEELKKVSCLVLSLCLCLCNFSRWFDFLLIQPLASGALLLHQTMPARPEKQCTPVSQTVHCTYDGALLFVRQLLLQLEDELSQKSMDRFIAAYLLSIWQMLTREISVKTGFCRSKCIQGDD